MIVNSAKMYLWSEVVVILVALIIHIIARPPEYDNVKHTRSIHARLLTDTAFCWGTDSICSVGLDLIDACDNLSDSGDTDKWYECLCGNGYCRSTSSKLTVPNRPT